MDSIARVSRIFSRSHVKPTVSPAKNSLVYFISIAYIDLPVWRSHREEAKRGPPSGHRITRNGAAMVSLLLPYATTGLSRIAGRCLIGATPRGQPRTSVSCTVRRPFVGRPVPRQLMRNELFDLTTIVPATAYHRRSYAERYSRYSTPHTVSEILWVEISIWSH